MIWLVGITANVRGMEGGGGVWHKASGSDCLCLPVAAAIGLSPLNLLPCQAGRRSTAGIRTAAGIHLPGGGGGGGTRPWCWLVCLWRRLLASRHCTF